MTVSDGGQGVAQAEGRTWICEMEELWGGGGALRAGLTGHNYGSF